MALNGIKGMISEISLLCIYWVWFIGILVELCPT